MATLFQGTLSTTLSDGNAQLVAFTGTGWSTTTSSITLTPPTGTGMPAIYVFQINAPADYNFTSGTGLTWGSSGEDAIYGIVVNDGESQAYLMAVDGVSGTPVSATVGFTLTVSAQSDLIPLDPAVSFNPPG